MAFLVPVIPNIFGTLLGMGWGEREEEEALRFVLKWAEYITKLAGFFP